MTSLIIMNAVHAALLSLSSSCFTSLSMFIEKYEVQSSVAVSSFCDIMSPCQIPFHVSVVGSAERKAPVQ